MGKNYDEIATVDIEISTPLVDDASFDKICIVGAEPLSPNQEEGVPVYPPAFGTYKSMDEVLEQGWSITATTPDPVALAAQVAFAQSPRPASICIVPIQYVTETVEGVSTQVPESVVNTVQRALNYGGWYVLCTACKNTDTAIVNNYGLVADLIETQDKMFCYTELNFFDASGTTIVGPAVSNTHYRTVAVFGKEEKDQLIADVPSLNNYINVAFAIKWLNYESGSETAAFKELALVSPAVLNSNSMELLKTYGVCYLITVGSKNVTMCGKVLAGEWADVIRFRDWLKNDMQVRIVNLFLTNPKIPYTDGGIALVENQMLASLKEGQDKGGIAQTEYDSDGNQILGYTTSVPLASEISTSVKQSRILTDCKFKARLAGAIHFAEISGSLTYEL